MAILTTTSGQRWRNHLRRMTVLIGALLLAGGPLRAAAADAAPSAEYQLKAVFLFNFAQFVDWPADAFREPDSPLVIGVLGQNPFGVYLDELVREEKVGPHPLVVRRYQRPEDIADCHILFVSGSERSSIDRIIAQLKGRSILTVSDVDTFTHQGGIVRFLTEGGKIRLRINVEEAKACRLTISSKILRPDMIVTREKD